MTPHADPPQHHPGLLVLHGNRLEQLAAAVFAWLADNPLAPMEEETFLVQSNGMAEWLKVELAMAHGICAATRVELPARFIWRAYRAVLGRDAVPMASALDKLPLTWRLMGLLAKLEGAEHVATEYAALAGFLRPGDATRRHQLAQRLADLFDQYQVYRSDWLVDWANGDDRLRGPRGPAVDVPEAQRWQPALWRAVLAGLDEAERSVTRPSLHQRFLQAVQGAQATQGVQAAQAAQAAPRLPRRIVVFGTTHLPFQTLEGIAALASHVQVLMAVPNPCRWYWSDLIDGRELLRTQRRRHALRGGRDLASLPLHELHAHGHPLLAAWGRQSRDFVRLLDAFDDVQWARQRFGIHRVDLFDDEPGEELLAQVQARIRDLVPLAEHAKAPVAAEDRSVVFHIAHSAQREVEILHDQLLHLLAHPPGKRPLAPRDIVIMVPDIESFAPAIRSVFGQHGRGHARHIPWSIVDQRERGRHPMLVALEWLLRAPQQRFAFSELRDLLDVPAVARRLGLQAEDLPTLVAWAEGAGIRWGLHAEQRGRLGLAACGEANTWRFGVRRMLLGYATGELHDAAAGHEGIEPYAEVAGLAAGLAGALAELLRVLENWWSDAAQPLSPAGWGRRLRALLQAIFAATGDAERALLAALDDGLSEWLACCETAGYEAPLELAVVREAWLNAIDEPGLSHRFKAGGVTFCTLLPLRAIPFEVVCLLGMNDGDYPRRNAGNDFELMAAPGLARPGDRSRRDDDRQLMLDALLSARRVLYVSWAGRSQRDNAVQPPSVLVSQWRDYLEKGWGKEVVEARTTEHPLQPFGRGYFEQRAEVPGGREGGRPALFTYAAEWRSAHEVPLSTAPSRLVPATAGPASPAVIGIERLARFLRNPVREFFRHRLQVHFAEIDAAAQDDEDFATAGLERWRLLDEVLRAARRSLVAEAEAEAQGGADTAVEGSLAQGVSPLVARLVSRLERAGRLPMAGPGARAEAGLVGTLVPMLEHWRRLQAAHPKRHDRQRLHLVHPEWPALMLDDWLPTLRSTGAAGEMPAWFDLQAGKLADEKLRAARAHKLIVAWLRCLASAACGCPARGVMVGADVVVQVMPPAPAPGQVHEARATLLDLMQACHESLTGERPLLTAVRTGLAFLADPGKAQAEYEGVERNGRPGEGDEASLARLAPDFASLRRDPEFERATQRLYEPFRAWLAQHVQLDELPDHAELGEEGDE